MKAAQKVLGASILLSAVLFAGGAVYAGPLNQAIRWTGWGYSDGYHSRLPAGATLCDVPAAGGSAVTPESAPSLTPPEPTPTPAPAPRSTRLPKNVWLR